MLKVVGFAGGMGISIQSLTGQKQQENIIGKIMFVVLFQNIYGTKKELLGA